MSQRNCLASAFSDRLSLVKVASARSYAGTTPFLRGRFHARGDSREMEGRLGGIRFRVGRPSAFVGLTMEAALACRGFSGVVTSCGSERTEDSRVGVEETVKALSDMTDDLDSWRKASIPVEGQLVTVQTFRSSSVSTNFTRLVCLVVIGNSFELISDLFV